MQNLFGQDADAAELKKMIEQLALVDFLEEVDPRTRRLRLEFPFKVHVRDSGSSDGRDVEIDALTVKRLASGQFEAVMEASSVSKMFDQVRSYLGTWNELPAGKLKSDMDAEDMLRVMLTVQLFFMHRALAEATPA